ncbi:MAG: PAS domain S-box protein [Chloroflexi bacterium]|nr:PAS domain S-box protein [Chloroflexota bacterium]MCC6894268.1 PAS domain S-box protein [Anaerolineae bacterium]
MTEVGNRIRPTTNNDPTWDQSHAYHELIAAAGNLFFTTDAKGFLLYVNSAVESILGFTPSEVIGKHFTEVVHPDWLDKVVPWYTGQFQDFTSETTLEFEVLSADGGRRWVEQIVRLIVDDGQVQGCNGLLHDITRRKAAENARRNIENSYLSASELSGAIVFIIDADGILLYTNPAMEKATGYQRGELIGQSVLQLIHTDEYQGFTQFMQLRSEGLYISPRREIRLIRKDGSICWLDIVANWSNIDGVPTILGSALDITERKYIEEQLKNSEFYVDQVNKTVPDLIYVLDLDKKSVLYWNRTFSSVLGYSDEQQDQFGMVTDFIHPDELLRFHQRIDTYPLLKDGEINEAIFRMKHNSGDWHWLHFRNTAFHRASDGRVNQVLAVTRDITEQVLAQEANERSEEQLRRSLQYQRALNEINIQIADLDTFDEIAKSAISFGIERLGFDRLGLMLYDAKTGIVRGTYGTDMERKVRDEHEFAQPVSNFTKWLSKSINGKKRVQVHDNTPLYDDGKIIGTGWNAMALLWQEDDVIGWLAADNLTLKEPLQEYQLELLGLYASALEHLYVRKRSEAQLLESNRRYDDLVANVPGVVYRTRRSPTGDYAFEYVSSLSKSLTGIEPQALFKDATLWMNQIVPEMRASYEEAITQIIANPQIFVWEGEVIVNGKRRWRRFDSSPRFTDDGSIIWDGILTDITERRNAEEGLRESELRYRTMVEQQTELISIYTPDTRMTFVNEALSRQVGRSRESLVGQSILTDTPLEYHAEILEMIAHSGASRQPFRHEHPIRIANGTMRWIEWTDTPIYDSKGALLKFQSVGRDIDDRKRTEAERNDYIARLEIIRRVDLELTEGLNFDHVLQIALDAAIRISRASAGAIHLLEDDQLRVAHVIGNFPDSMVGQTLQLTRGIVGRVARRSLPELITDVNLDPDYLPNVIETRAQMTLPLVSQDRLIGVLNVQTTEPDLFTRPMFDFLKVLAVRIASALDNARLHFKTEKQVVELTNLYQQVSELEQLKTQMIRIAAHDLRNPLGVISGYVQMLQEELDDHLTERSHDQLEAIRDSINRIDKITRDILTLERIAAGREMASERVDLTQLVKDAFVQIKLQAVEKGQDYQLEQPDVSVYVQADRFLLPETVINLLTNAIKYTPNGGAVQVRLAVEDKKVIFTVVDNGYGIPLDMQENLFQAFYRVKTKETKGINGTGLGLHLVKTIIERHKGHMRFQSEYGKGSTFGFELPLLETSAASNKRRSAARKSS